TVARDGNAGRLDRHSPGESDLLPSALTDALDDGLGNPGRDRQVTAKGRYRQLRPARNQHWDSGDALKNANSIAPIFWRAAVAGCVPSLGLKSLGAHMRPSDRGRGPAAHGYGPHAIHGAMPVPELKLPARASADPLAISLICASTVHLTANPLS